MEATRCPEFDYWEFQKRLFDFCCSDNAVRVDRLECEFNALTIKSNKTPMKFLYFIERKAAEFITTPGTLLDDQTVKLRVWVGVHLILGLAKFLYELFNLSFAAFRRKSKDYVETHQNLDFDGSNIPISTWGSKHSAHSLNGSHIPKLQRYDDTASVLFVSHHISTGNTTKRPDASSTVQQYHGRDHENQGYCGG